MGFLLEMIFHTPLLLMSLLAMFPSFCFIALRNSVFTFAMMYHDLFIGLTFIITTIYLIEWARNQQTTNQARAYSQVAFTIFVDTC